MSKTLVCTNVLSNVESLAYGSHCQEWYRMGRNTQDKFILFHPDRYSIDNARNQAARWALQVECDYIYFLDDDMVLSPNTYRELKNVIEEREAAIVQALTFIRSPPFEPMFFINKGTDEELKLEYYRDYEKDIDKDGCVSAYAVGFACALLDVKYLLEVSPPYFVTGAYTTEDVYYCLKLREKFKSEVKIFVNTNVPTGHIISPEIVTKANRERLLAYVKPEAENKSKLSDRAKEYLEECRLKLESLKLQKKEIGKEQNSISAVAIPE